MNALVLTKLKTPLELQERPLPTLEPGESLIELKAAALNRRDYWITRGMYPGIELPMILGSDGTGVVIESAGEDQSWVSKEVIINPGIMWGNSAAAQSGDFRILGMPDHGTLTTHVVVPTAQLFDRPQHLNWHESAALPLAALTAYRAVFVQGELKPNQTVLVSGVGGGVATFALQFAKAFGAKVIVTSSATEKINAAMQMGAHAGYDYNETGWATQLMADHGLADLIVDGAGGAGYAELLDAVAPGGRIVNYGSTQGPPEQLDMFKVFWKQMRIIGSTMGSPDDFANMLKFVEAHSIRPVIHEVFPLSQGNAALDVMSRSTQFGKLVLNTLE
jgi:NADPH:quinone reductase-like Zn-dependent oxidoreductase